MIGSKNYRCSFSLCAEGSKSKPKIFKNKVEINDIILVFVLNNVLFVITKAEVL